VQCQVRYDRRRGSTYGFNAVCTSESAIVQQNAVVRQTGERTFSGQFYNDEYDVKVSISIVVDGDNQIVDVSAGSIGSARLELTPMTSATKRGR
jgi:hypothetical protein